MTVNWSAIMGDQWHQLHFITAYIWTALSVFLWIFILLETVSSDFKPAQFLLDLNKYGKHENKTSNIWKWMFVPKSSFTNFYKFSSVFSTSLLIFMLMENSWRDFLFENELLNPVFLSLKMLHEPLLNNKTALTLAMTLSALKGIRRLYECCRISTFSKKAKMNLIQYAVGFAFYTFEPITILLLSIPISNLSYGPLSLVQLTALMCWILASMAQHKCAIILANLRAEAKKDYMMPKGFLFDYISCPHYFTEMVIYICVWAILDFNFLYLLVILFVLSIHVDMAYTSQRWLVKTFKAYPSNRYVLIPFLW